MSNETIADLRSHLFSALRGLTDKDTPMDVERAKAVSEVAQTLINSAKVEIDHMKIAGGSGSGFISAALPLEAGVIHQAPGVTVRRHVLK